MKSYQRKFPCVLDPTQPLKRSVICALECYAHCLASIRFKIFTTFCYLRMMLPNEIIVIMIRIQ